MCERHTLPQAAELTRNTKRRAPPRNRQERLWALTRQSQTKAPKHHPSLLPCTSDDCKHSISTVTTKGSYSPAGLVQDIFAAASKTVSPLCCCFSDCTCKFTQRRLIWTLYLQGQNPPCTNINTTSSTGSLPRNALNSYHHILDHSWSSQSDISTLWPTCLPQQESLTTVSPWYDCSCTHPICQRTLFPATCCAFLEIAKTISAHDNSFKASSHISPQLFVNDTATDLELEARAATIKWLKILLDLH